MPETDPIDSPDANEKEWKLIYMKPYIEPREVQEKRVEAVKISLHFAVTSLKNIWHDIIDPHRKK